MKINPIKLGIATATVFGVIWVLCSALVVVIPRGMMQLSGHMVHADFGHMGWTMNIGGLFYGLIAWSVISGIIAVAIAALYNRIAEAG